MQPRPQSRSSPLDYLPSRDDVLLMGKSSECNASGGPIWSSGSEHPFSFSFLFSLAHPSYSRSPRTPHPQATVFPLLQGRPPRNSWPPFPILSLGPGRWQRTWLSKFPPRDAPTPGISPHLAGDRASESVLVPYLFAPQKFLVCGRCDRGIARRGPPAVEPAAILEL